MKKQTTTKSTEATEKKPMKSAEFLKAAAAITATARKSVKVEKSKSGKDIAAVKPTAKEALAFILEFGGVVSELVEAAKIARDNAKAEGSKAFKGEVAIVCEKVKGIKLDDAAVIKLGTAAMKRALNLGDYKALIAEHLAK